MRNARYHGMYFSRTSATIDGCTLENNGWTSTYNYPTIMWDPSSFGNPQFTLRNSVFRNNRHRVEVYRSGSSFNWGGKILIANNNFTTFERGALDVTIPTTVS